MKSYQKAVLFDKNENYYILEYVLTNNKFEQNTFEKIDFL